MVLQLLFNFTQCGNFGKFMNFVLGTPRRERVKIHGETRKKTLSSAFQPVNLMRVTAGVLSISTDIAILCHLSP